MPNKPTPKGKTESVISLEINTELKNQIDASYLELKIKAITARQTAPRKKDYIEFLLKMGKERFSVKEFDKFLDGQKGQNNHK